VADIVSDVVADTGADAGATHVVCSPCAGLVVGVPEGIGVHRPGTDWVLAQVQSAATGEIVDLCLPAGGDSSASQVVTGVYVRVGDHVRGGEALLAVGPPVPAAWSRLRGLLPRAVRRTPARGSATRP
jgi:biotin carboxyl carrier protein